MEENNTVRTKNLWEIFHIGDIQHIVQNQNQSGSIIRHVNDTINNISEAINRGLLNYRIRLTRLNFVPGNNGGLIAEFQYKNTSHSDGIVNALHASFHPVGSHPDSSQIHIQYDVEPRFIYSAQNLINQRQTQYGSKQRDALNSMGQNKWLDLSINYKYNDSTRRYSNFVINSTEDEGVDNYINRINNSTRLARANFSRKTINDKNIIIIILSALSTLLDEFNRIISQNEEQNIEPVLNRQMSNIGQRVNVAMDARLQQKYLKYKQKYLELKKLLESMNIKN